jgi:hypothetical protein
VLVVLAGTCEFAEVAVSAGETGVRASLLVTYADLGDDRERVRVVGE